MWSKHFFGFVLNFRCRYSFLSISATICSGKWQRQTSQFLKYVVMTTHFQLLRTAAVLSLNLALQNLIGRFVLPNLVPPGGAVYNGVENNPNKEGVAPVSYTHLTLPTILRV